jgi:tRNA (guanine10-N2)-methyltransferase
MGRRRLMCFFLHRHLSFRLAEFQGVAERVYGRTTWDDGLPVAVWERPLDDMTRAAFWYVHLPDDGDGLALDMAAQIADSCFLLRVILDPWADGHSLPELLEQLVAFDPAEKDAFSNDAWKIQAEAWGVSMTQEQKVALINAIGPSLPELRGPISMRDPKQTYWVIASWPFEYPVAYLRSWIFFGRQIGVNTSRGAILSKYDLRRRRYLGPTSMDSELAFLMCNMCRIRKSSFVVDPFVGTGGLLVPAAHQGAVTLGMDIDVRVIKFGKKDNKGRKVNVWTNFEDYELDPPVGLLRADLDRNPFKTDMRDMFDAILADPPYGVRAGGRKSNSRPDVLIRDRSTHIPATAPYPLGDCLADLLDWAARVLVPGGRLAYWAPALPLDEEGVGTAVTSGMVSSSEELPQHPNLVTKFNCEQILGGRYNRRLIVMEKVEGKPYDENEVKRYFVDNPPVPMSIDSLWDVVYAPTDKTRPDKSERTRTFRGKHV